MTNDKPTSLTVLLTLIAKLKDSEDKDDIIEEITSILVVSGVCTEQDIQELNKKFESMVLAIESKLATGVSYKEAYKRVSKKYPEFNNINLN
jgi:mannitol/fructose-specific phosphotransferase system IIA component (Ntr-type)